MVNDLRCRSADGWLQGQIRGVGFSGLVAGFSVQVLGTADYIEVNEAYPHYAPVPTAGGSLL